MMPGRHILSAAPRSITQHFLRLKMLGINIHFKGVCDHLFGLKFSFAKPKGCIDKFSLSYKYLTDTEKYISNSTALGLRNVAILGRIDPICID